ncbi:hypothetical protein C0992_009074 [Termitomyces sp. T32_za158]|nr:hypothetical protein C0992_009074 [Termitomyces sp. T32_za158]
MGQTEPSSGTVAPLTSLLYVSKTVLLQAVDLLDNYLTSDDQLTVSSKFLCGSTIGLILQLSRHCMLKNVLPGKHLRHARDHFVLLMDSVCSPPPHILSYDKRGRNTPMESSRSAARAALMEAIQQLETHVPLAQMDTPIILHAVTPDLQEFQTTFGREVGGNLFEETLVECQVALVRWPTLCPSLVNGTRLIFLIKDLLTEVDLFRSESLQENL